MTSSLLVLAGMMAIVVGWLVWPTLNAKPWVEQRTSGTLESDGALPLPTIKVGLGVFLAVVTSLFALLISAYHMRMTAGDWTALAPPRVLWLNTAVLIAGGAAMQWTRNAARRGQVDRVRTGLIVSGALTFAFLAGQIWAWQQLSAAGYYLASDPAAAFFYLLTAVHGIHLLGGLWVWARTTGRVLRGVDVAKVRMSVELCTVYWHYLLLVWLVLFAVLLHTQS